MIQKTDRNTQASLEILCHIAVVLYAIWYTRNLVRFQGRQLDVHQTLNLIKLWQHRYDLKSYYQVQPPKIHKQHHGVDVIRTTQNHHIGNHIWFKGIKRGKQRNKIIEIHSILTTEGKVSQLGLFRHIGQAPTHVIMCRALR